MAQERRSDIERRKRPTPLFSRYAFHGRRMHSRREDNSHDYYVDRYGYKYLFLILGIVCLSILDAYLTLNLLRGGGIELNPFMSLLINQNAMLFLTVKIIITSICILFLLMHKNFRFYGTIRMNRIIYVVFSLYVVLIVYEIYLYASHLGTDLTLWLVPIQITSFI